MDRTQETMHIEVSAIFNRYKPIIKCILLYTWYAGLYQTGRFIPVLEVTWVYCVGLYGSS